MPCVAGLWSPTGNLTGPTERLAEAVAPTIVMCLAAVLNTAAGLLG